ncbi:MAG: hypothetical protein ACTSU5_11145 [Promethearchaeota archaeon]
MTRKLSKWATTSFVVTTLLLPTILDLALLSGYPTTGTGPALGVLGGRKNPRGGYSFSQPGTIPEEVSKSRVNLARNPGFEYWTGTPNEPREWNTAGSAYGRASRATYTGVDDSNSARLHIQSVHSSDTLYIHQQFAQDVGIPIDSNTSLALNWNVTSNDHAAVNDDYARVRLVFNNTNQLRYYFSGYANFNASTYYNLNLTGNGIQDSWAFSWANITGDYLREFGVHPNDVNITDIYIETYSQFADAPVEAFVDNVTIRVDYGANRVSNPSFTDLKVGTTDVLADWVTQDRNAGHAGQETNTVSGGSASARMSVEAPDRGTTYSLSTVSMDTQFPTWGRAVGVTDDHRPEVSFNWYLDQLAGAGNYPEGFAQLSFLNSSAAQEYLVLYVYFARCNPASLVNSTNYHYIVLPEVNQTGAWHHTTVDLYAEVTQFPGVTAANLTQVLFYLGSNTAGGAASVVLDDISVRGEAIMNGGFESGLAYWGNNTSGLSTVETCADAHGGSSALNVTARQGHSIYAYQINVFAAFDAELALDLYWKLYGFAGASSSNDYAGALVQTVGNKYIYYIFACGNDWNVISNTSTQAVYLVDSFNSTGSWVELRRNVYRDYEAATTSPVDPWDSVQQVTFFSTASSVEVGLLVDDVLLGPTVPLVEGVDVAGGSPSYHEPVTVTVDLFDSGLGINASVLYYRNENGGAWNLVEMAETDAEAMLWAGSVPRQPYNTTVWYYVEVQDKAGVNATTPSSAPGTPGSFVVGDTLAPSIEHVTVSPGEPSRMEQARVNATITDPGSGINTTEVVYSTDGGQTWKRVNMSAQTGVPWSANYTALLPKLPAYTVVFYYVESKDLEGNLGRDDRAGLYYVFVVRTEWTSTNAFLYGMLAGAAALAALFGSGKLVAKRRRANVASGRTPPPRVTKPARPSKPARATRPNKASKSVPKSK